MGNHAEVNAIITFANASKAPVKATCIEAMEFATKAKPEIVSEESFDFFSKALADKAPRVKWESAKVIGNIAHLYTDKMDEAIKNLLANAGHDGTVVRWSAAFALGQIVKMKTAQNKTLLPAIEAICNRVEKNSIKKIYLDAIKKAKS